jgi:hypothetical protein
MLGMRIYSHKKSQQTQVKATPNLDCANYKLAKQFKSKVQAASIRAAAQAFKFLSKDTRLPSMA